MSIIQEDTSIAVTKINIESIISELMLLLSEREKDIIFNRYALNTENKKHTLALIGKKYGVTRERVRQMENTALEKLRRISEKTKLNIINEFAYNAIRKKGFIMNEEYVVSLILNVLKDRNLNRGNIKLAIDLERRLAKINNTIKYSPYWRTNDIKEEKIKEISHKIEQILKRAEEKHMDIDHLCDLLKNAFPNFSNLTFKAIFGIDKNLKIRENMIGLANDINVNPKTLRAKILYVLRKHNKPLHFIEIANAIIKEKFDNKVINKQAIHNDCIRHIGFVLIGRGIYALKEWGYKAGTVKDIICDILKDGEPKSRDEIVKQVKEQRIVKDVTISLNLKSKGIKRVGRDQYVLA